MEAIKEYLKSRCGVETPPLAYIIRKTVTVRTYGNYPWYATSDDKMMTRMFHITIEQNRHCTESMASCRKELTTLDKIDNEQWLKL